MSGLSQQSPRRAVLALIATSTMGALAGCSKVLGSSDGGDEEVENPAEPEILNIQIELDALRNPETNGTVHTHIVNNGPLGEIKTTVEMKGKATTLASAEDLISLEEGQEYQQRHDPSTNLKSGGEEIPYADPEDVVVTVESTADPDTRDQWNLEEDGTYDENVIA